MKRWLLTAACLAMCGLAFGLCDAPRHAAPSATPGGDPDEAAVPEVGSTALVLRPARLWDGVTADVHENWVVVVKGDKITGVGPADKTALPAGARVIELPNTTLLP